MLTQKPGWNGYCTRTQPWGNALPWRSGKLSLLLQGNKKRDAHWASLLCNSKLAGSFIGDNDPQDQVKQESWHAAGDQCDQECQPEPKSTDTEKTCQPTTNTGKDAVISRPAQYSTYIWGHDK